MDLVQNYFVEIPVNPAGEPYKDYQFPWTPTLEGKTIVGIETYVENSDGTSYSTVPPMPAFLAPLFSIIIKNKDKKAIVELPYKALATTGMYQQNLSPGPGVQPRQIKPRFSFVFSSKDTFLKNNSTSPFPVTSATAYICFKYLP